MAKQASSGASTSAAVGAASQVAQSLVANYYARTLDKARVAAANESGQRQRELRDSSNAAAASVSNTERFLQSQRAQRAAKNAGLLFAQGQEALVATATSRAAADFQTQITGSRNDGANAARSAASGVAGDATPAEMALSLATARQRASLSLRATQETDDLTIRSSRALAAVPVAGDLTTLLPGLDRRFTPKAYRKSLPSTLDTLVQGVAGLSTDQMMNLAQAGTGVYRQFKDRFGSGNLQDDFTDANAAGDY